MLIALKKCTKCKEDKLTSEFHLDSSKQFGVASRCKGCMKEFRDLNKTEIREKTKKYALSNPDKISASRVKYNENNRDKERIRVKKYRDSNKEKIAKSDKLYNETKRDKEAVKARNKALREKYLLDNAEYIKNKKDAKKRENEIKKIAFNKNNNIRIKERRINDSLFRMKDTLRARTRKAFRNKYNKKNTNSELLGISYESLYTYIESMFTEGMSWDLFGKHIHIDHIIPLASASTEDELIKLCHYTNLQPLWAEDNIRKGDSMPENFKKSKGTL